MTKFDLTQNIRDITKLDDTELRASMEKSGWLRQFPAFVDENGSVIVGHRRMTLAEELQIKPVVEIIQFGNGSAGDAKRVELAIASNIGMASLSKSDRKRIAVLAYQHGYTQDQIGKLLGVAQKTISKDLAGNYTGGINQKTAKTASNPKGSGRRKGSGTKANKSKETKTVRGEAAKYAKARELVRPLIETDQALKTAELEQEHGISKDTFERAALAEQARKDVFGELEIDPSTLSMTAQQKLDLAIRQATHRLEAEIKQRVRAENLKWMEVVLAGHRKKEEHYNLIISRHKGVLTSAEYNLLWSCLHPDSRNSTSDEKLARAFQLFTKLENLIIEAKDPVAKYGSLPKTTEELLKRKAEYDEKRAAERAAKRNKSTSNVARH